MNGAHEAEAWNHSSDQFHHQMSASISQAPLHFSQTSQRMPLLKSVPLNEKTGFADAPPLNCKKVRIASASWAKP